MADNSTPPVAVDPVGAFAVSVISQLMDGVAAPLIEAAAETAEPELAWPIVKQIFEATVGYLAGKLSVMEQEGVLQLVFAIEEDSKLYSMGQALLVLQAANASGDPNAISKATQDAANQWGSTIHWPGVAPIVT